MSYRVNVINKKGEEMLIFGNNELPDAFKSEIVKQGAKLDEYDEFRFAVKDINGIIDSIEEYIKESSEYFMNNKERYHKIVDFDNKVLNTTRAKSNSLFDFTNDFVPYRKDVETGYDEMPIWAILKMNIPVWTAFSSLNFINFISDSIEYTGEGFRLRDGEEIIIYGR